MREDVALVVAAYKRGKTGTVSWEFRMRYRSQANSGSNTHLELLTERSFVEEDPRIAKPAIPV